VFELIKQGQFVVNKELAHYLHAAAM